MKKTVEPLKRRGENRDVQKNGRREWWRLKHGRMLTWLVDMWMMWLVDMYDMTHVGSDGAWTCRHLNDMSHSYVRHDSGQVVIRLVGQVGRHAVCCYLLLYVALCCSHHCLHSYPRLLSPQTPFPTSESQCMSPCKCLYIPLRVERAQERRGTRLGDSHACRGCLRRWKSGWALERVGERKSC